MGVKPKDYDYVVVGSSPEKMIELNFKIVGADFPVFLHPTTGDEYALARTERKTGEGYNGFTCEWEGVTLEEDLSRRDLTINSVAIEIDYDTSILLGELVTIGTWIDPFNGIDDIRSRVLRRTTEHFAEDPLRVLRVARFMARLGNHWYITKDTLDLMKTIYCSGELLNLTPERVWLETEKALGEKYPSLYFRTLKEFNHLFIDINNGRMAMQKLDHHPEGDVFRHQELVVDYAAKTFGDKEVNLACMLHDLGKYPCWLRYGSAHGHETEGLPLVVDFCNKWRVPTSYKKLALIVCEYHTKVHGCMGRSTNDWMRQKSIMKLFEDTGALRNPSIFSKMLMCCEADADGSGSEQILEFENKPYPQRQYLQECLDAVVGMETKSISTKMLAENKSGVMIGEVIRQERIKLIRGVCQKWKQKM